MAIESALVAAGISAAVGVGSSLLINALTPAQTVRSGGLGDLSVPSSSYGAVVPQCWGQVKQSGILLHSAPIREVTETTTQGGKGGPRVRQETVTRFGSFAVLLAYCPHRSAEALKRLWLNDQLVFDAEATDPDTQQASAEFLANHLRFYTGSFDQPIDPSLANAVPIQAYDFGLPHDPIERANALTALGLDPNLNHIPAYRFKCYVVLENLDLTPYNGQLPTVKAEVLYNSDNNLETIITDLCNQAEITNIDTSGIQDIFVPGYYLDSETTAKEAIKTLQQAYFFDVIKSGKTYRFIRHSVDRNVVDIPLEDLAAHQVGSNRPVTFRLPQPDLRDLPRSIEINYIDQEGGFESGNVISRSQIATSRRKETYTFPIVMSADQAQQIVDNLLHRFYLEAIRPPELQLTPKYGFLEVGDRLNIAFFGEIYQLQITRIQTGANRLLRIDIAIRWGVRTKNEKLE